MLHDSASFQLMLCLAVLSAAVKESRKGVGEVEKWKREEI